MINDRKKKLHIFNNFIKTNEDIDEIEKSLKKKYLNNKAYVNFLNNLLKDTLDKYSKILDTTK